MRYSNTLHYELQAVNPDNLERLKGERYSWRENRMKCEPMAELFRYNCDKYKEDEESKGAAVKAARYEKYAERVEGCAGWLDFKTLGDKRELKAANFCKVRLCPMCTARGAIVRAKLLSKIMDAVQVEHECQYIFLTLTVKNVEGDKLGEEIGELTKAWHRLLQHQAVKRAVKGWFRALEITRNSNRRSKDYGTFHPHIHAIIAVEDGYFRKKNKLYITPDEWGRRWRMALGVDYDPSVKICKTTGRKGGRGAALEAAKYVTKDSDYIDSRLSVEEAAQIVDDYTDALFHRRLTAYGGWLKEMAQRLKAGDLDNVDLEHVDDGTIRDDMAEMIESYGWHYGAGDYVLAKREMNPLRLRREQGGDSENEG